MKNGELLNLTKRQVKGSSTVRKGFWYSLAGVILLSTNFITAKYSLSGFNVTTFSFLWALQAGLWALVATVVTGHCREIKIQYNMIFKIMLVGFFAGLSMLLNWGGLSYLDPSFTSFLRRFFPIITILLAFIFLGERLTRLEMLPGLLMIFGSLVSAFGRWDIVGIGVTLSLLSCLAAAIQQIISKVSVINVHPLVLTFYRGIIAAATIGAWGCINGALDFDVSLRYWVVTGIGSFLAPFAGTFFIYYAYKYWEVSRSSILMTLQPLFVLVMAIIFLNKVPHIRELIGGFFILAGAFWINWLQIRKKTG